MKTKEKKKEVKKPIRQDHPLIVSWKDVFENEDNPSSLDTYDGEL